MTIVFLGNFSVDYSSETHHAKSLEALGHKVIRLQEGEYFKPIDTPDLFVWVHTHGWQTPNIEDLIRQMKATHTPIVSYHLDLWFGLDRQKDLANDPFYGQIDHWFVTDKLMADWLNDNTDVKGHYLPAGVFHEEAIMLDPQGHDIKYPPKQFAHLGPTELFTSGTARSKERPNDVVFVGSKGYHPEWPYRPQLIDWLSETYGERFGHYSGEEGTKGLKRGLHLNQLYADSKIVVGDTLCLNFDYPYYFSDRLFETTGRGGFLIMPYIKGLEDNFELGKELVTYEFGNFEQLKTLIDYYLETPHEREAIRLAGFERAKKSHTYKDRWQHILVTMGFSNLPWKIK